MLAILKDQKTVAVFLWTLIPLLLMSSSVFGEQPKEVTIAGPNPLPVTGTVAVAFPAVQDVNITNTSVPIVQTRDLPLRRVEKFELGPGGAGEIVLESNFVMTDLLIAVRGLSACRIVIVDEALPPETAAILEFPMGSEADFATVTKFINLTTGMQGPLKVSATPISGRCAGNLILTGYNLTAGS